jgi:EmrB/QacA subfamily drug resistance transporter
MEILDGAIIATAAPAIAFDLNVEPVDVSAAITSYLVALAAGLPVSGWLTEKYGGRRIMLVAIAIFTVASGLCAASVNLPMLVTFRVLQGAGGALMVPVGRLVVLRVTAKSDLIQAIAYLTWPALLAPVIAPTLGGWIVTVASWHWIFLVNLPLGIIAFFVSARIVPSAPDPTTARLDWVGFLFSAAALASLLMTLELVRSREGGLWATAAVATVLLASVGATIWWFRRTPHPLLSFEPLRVPSFRVANVGGSIYRLVINSVPFLLPLMFQLGFGWSAARSGLLLMVLFAGNVAIKPATTPLLRRLGFRTVLIWSVVGGAAVIGGLAALRPSTPLAVVLGALFVSGALRSVGFSAYNSLQFAGIPGPTLADANTLSATMQQVAAALGVSIGALLLRVADQALGARFSPVAPYTVALSTLALLMAHPLVQVLRLSHSAGSEVTGRYRSSAATQPERTHQRAADQE